MRNNRPLLRALVAGLVLATGISGRAYDIIRTGSPTLPIKWRAGTVPLVVKLGSAATYQDGTNPTTSFQAAVDLWNQNVRNIQLSTTTGTGSGGDGNGINEMFFSADIYGDAWEEKTLAVTTNYRSTVQSDNSYRRLEADILFNSNRTWNSYRGALRNSTTVGIDLRRVALHELGHLAGLDHPDESGQTVSAIMNSTISSEVENLEQDDLEGVQYLYGTPGNFTRPANNDFASATVITLTSGNNSLAGTSLNATKETGEPNHANNTGGASVWWKWVAPSDGALTLNTTNTHFDTLLAVYTGSAVNALTQVAANDDSVTPEQDPSPTRPRTSVVTIATIANGTTYYIVVDGWQGEWGTIAMNASFTPSANAPTITTQPVSQTVTAGASVTFSVVATGTPAPTYQWSKGGTAISGATSASYTISSTTTADAGNYTVTVTNNAGSVTSNTATLTVNTPTPPPAPSGGGGGGGGAPSPAFLAALALAALARWGRRRQ